MRKILYTLILLIFFSTSYFSYKIISDQYDKQNSFILKIKELVPNKLKNDLRNYVYDIRAFLNQKKIEKLQKDKFDQGLNGDLIKYKEIKSESDSQKYLVREFFLPFKRLDLTYGWRALENSKRAHYLDVIDDKTIVVSGEGEFIFFDTKNFNSKSLNQTRIKSNLDELISKENYTLIGLRDLLIDDGKIYISVILKNLNEKYSISILSSDINFEKLKFEFFFESKLNVTNYSIGTGGRIVNYKDNKLLFSIGHFSVLDQIQDKNNLAGKIISINKSKKNYDLISLGHRNQQGLFFFEDDMNKQFIINSEHGPKGGDEINVNDLKKDKLYNFGWPIASYGINYDGTNPFKQSHEEHGYDEPLTYFTPSIGISEISVQNNNKYNTIFASSLRATSIYIIKTNKEFTKVINMDRLILDYRIRDIKYVKSLGGHIVIFENVPSVGFIKSYE